MSYLSDLLTGKNQKRAEEERRNLERARIASLARAKQSANPVVAQQATQKLQNKSYNVAPVKQPSLRQHIENATGTVGLGLGRSAIGTAQGLSGMYDLMTLGKGTNRLSQSLDTRAKRFDQIQRDQNRSEIGYKAGQFLGDAGTFLAGGGVVGGATKGVGYGVKAIPGASKVINPAIKGVTKVAKPVGEVTKHIPIGIQKGSAALAQKGAAGRLAAAGIRNGTTKSQLLNTGVDMTIGLGQPASKGQDIGLRDVAIQGGMSTTFGVGLPVTAQGVKEIFRAPSRYAIQNMPVRAEALNGQDIADLRNWRNAMGTGKTMGEQGQAIYNNGRRASQKAGIDYRDGDAIDNVVGINRRYNDQVGRQIDTAKAVNNWLNENVPVGLGIKNVDGTGKAMSVDPKTPPVEKTALTPREEINQINKNALELPEVKARFADGVTTPPKTKVVAPIQKLKQEMATLNEELQKVKSQLDTATSEAEVMRLYDRKDAINTRLRQIVDTDVPLAEMQNSGVKNASEKMRIKNIDEQIQRGVNESDTRRLLDEKQAITEKLDAEILAQETKTRNAAHQKYVKETNAKFDNDLRKLKEIAPNKELTPQSKKLFDDLEKQWKDLPEKRGDSFTGYIMEQYGKAQPTSPKTVAPKGAPVEKTAQQKTWETFNNRNMEYVDGKTTEMVPIEELSKYMEFDRAKSPLLSSESFAKLEADIAKNGIQEPLILNYGAADRIATLGEGNHRLVIAKKLGITDVPVKVTGTRLSKAEQIDAGKGYGAVRGAEPDQFGYVPSSQKPSDIGIRTSQPKATPKSAPVEKTPKQWFNNQQISDIDKKFQQTNPEEHAKRGGITQISPSDGSDALWNVTFKDGSTIDNVTIPALPDTPVAPVAKTTPTISKTETVAPVEKTATQTITKPKTTVRKVPQINEEMALTKTGEQGIVPPKKPPVAETPPQIGAGKQKTSKFASETIPNSEYVSKPIKDATKEGAPLYTPQTEKDGLLSAVKRLKAEGDDAFETKVRKSLDKEDGTISRQEALDAQVYAAKLEEFGDELNVSKASEIYDRLSAHYTKAGQLIQAAAMMSRRTPQGMRNYAMKKLEKAGIKITPEIQKEIDTAVAQLKKTKPETDARAKALDDLMHIVAKNTPMSVADQFVNVWRANLLTAPTTTLGGFVGNIDNLITRKLWVNPIGTMVDMAQSIFTGKRGLTIAPKGSAIKGAGEGFGEVFNKRYWRTGYDSMDALENFGKYDNPRHATFSDNLVGKTADKWTNAIYRTMGAVDKPYRYGARNEALASIAKAEAINRGLKGAQRSQFIKEFMANPPEDVMNRAIKEGRYNVFQDETALGSAIGGVSQRFKQKGWNTAAAVVDFIVPFKQIPGSIATRIVKRTPIGTAQEIVKQFVAVKKKGEPYDQRAMSQAIAEGFSAAPIVGAGYALAAAGQLTGGYPSDEKERKLWQAEGKQPNSVKVGDRWYSLNYIQPFGAILNIGAGAHQAAKDGKDNMEQVWAGIAEAGKSVSDMSFLQGVSGAIDAFKNPEMAAERFISNTASSTVPNFVRSFAAATDDYERQAVGVKEGIQSAIPGWRQQLPTKKDAFGNDVPTKDNFLNRYVNPLKPSVARTDETTAEMRRLQDSELGTMPTESNTKVFGESKPLDKKQLNDLNAYTAKKVSTAWNDIIKSTEYKNLSDEDKKKTLDSAKKDYTAVARAEWAAKNNKISDEWQPDLTAKQKKLASGETPDYVYAGLPKDLSQSAKKILIAGDGADDNWKKQKNTDQDFTKAISSWLPKGVRTPQNLTNEIAKQWAEYERDRLDGKINDIEANTKKRTILSNAYKSELDDVTQSFYKLGDDAMRNELNKGTISREQMNKVIEIDNILTSMGIQKYSQVGKKLRAELGYGAVSGKSSSGSSRSSKSRSTKGGGSSPKFTIPDGFSLLPSSGSSISSIVNLLHNAKVQGPPMRKRT